MRHIDGRRYLSAEQREERGFAQHGKTAFERFVDGTLIPEGTQKAALASCSVQDGAV